MDLIRDDPQMYMSPVDVMLFESGVDVGPISMFSNDFMSTPTSPDGQKAAGFNSPSSFLKMNGLVTSP